MERSRFCNNLRGDLELLDFLVAGQVIHQVEHQLFEDHPQAARADLTLQGLLRDRVARPLH